MSSQIKMKAKTDLKLSQDLETTKSELHKMSMLATRRGRIASIAMIARRTAQSKSQQTAETLNRLMSNMDKLLMQSEARQAVIDARGDHIKR